MTSIFRSDIPTNNFLTYLFAAYIGTMIFILNIVVLSYCSINNFINVWQDVCENRISVEIPASDITVSNILNVKTILEKSCCNVKVLEFGDIKNVVDKLNFNINIQEIGTPKILEAMILKKTNIKNVISDIKNISSNILIYVHKDFLSPSVKIANFISSNYVMVVGLIFVSIILYAFLYSYQNLRINSESIHILISLAADRTYIFKQILLGLLKCFFISFFISIFCSIIFVFSSSIIDYFSYSKYFALCMIVVFPVLVYLLITLISRFAIFYFLEKRKTFL